MATSIMTTSPTSTTGNGHKNEHSPPQKKESCLFTLADQTSIFCEDLTKPDNPCSTGIGFLDHMLDQLNSHAQIGVSLTIADHGWEAHHHQQMGSLAAAAGTTTTGIEEANQQRHDDLQNRNRYANHDQAKLLSYVGKKLGVELKRLLEQSKTTGRRSRFACPLDEALVVCTLQVERNDFSAAGNLASFTLPPYGKKFPRTRIGSLETEQLHILWQSLAEHSGLNITLRKVRGDNAHHIVEAAFKAFSRALRNLLDGIDTRDTTDVARIQGLFYGGPDCAKLSTAAAAPAAAHRQGSVQRQTKETSISVTVRIDGGASGIQIDTGLSVLNDFFTSLFTCANMSCTLSCQGDLWIDEHHTAEDVAIAVGQCLNQALGTKAGLNRMWCAEAEIAEAGSTNPEDTTKVEVVMDLSNRPCLRHNLDVLHSAEWVGDVPTEMIEHVLDSLVVHSAMTVHVVQVHASPTRLHDLVLVTAQAMGQALRFCAMPDSRRDGVTASSKGTLSV